LLPRAEGEWRLGKEKFAARFEMDLDAGLTADEAVAEAESEFRRLEGELYTLSRQLWAGCSSASPVRVLAEAAGERLGPQVAVGRRQKPHVHPACPLVLDPFQFPLLQHAQQRGLQLERNLPNGPQLRRPASARTCRGTRLAVWKRTAIEFGISPPPTISSSMVCSLPLDISSMGLVARPASPKYNNKSNYNHNMISCDLSALRPFTTAVDVKLRLQTADDLAVGGAADKGRSGKAIRSGLFIS
jgi:hypothetical protein